MRKVVMFYPHIHQEAVDNAVSVLQSRWVGEGDWVQDFEHALVEKFRFPRALALNSGTSGLRLALAVSGAGDQPGDEVITTAMTCTATNMPILEQRAVPVFADIQWETGNIDPEDVKRRLTERTRAIMCVHWGGYPCDLDELNAIAAKHGVPVIEDAAHALGAVYRGHPVGGISAYTMFSLQAIKQLTSVDGGVLVCRDEEKHHEARIRRWKSVV